jgi:hypothetical protein
MHGVEYITYDGAMLRVAGNQRQWSKVGLSFVIGIDIGKGQEVFLGERTCAIKNIGGTVGDD